MRSALFLFGVVAMTTTLRADSFVVTYEAAGTQTVNANLCSGISACTVGVQGFSNWSGGAFTTDFGTGGSILGSYTGGMERTAANQYGGAGGSGYYAEVYARDGGYTLNLTTANGVPGVNYFGLWFSALDQGNLLQFYGAGKLVYEFTPADFSALVGACRGSNPFCGNPNAAFKLQDSTEQFAFLNFFDQDGLIDQILFSETGGGGFESDNHTVAYMSPAQPTSGTIVGTYTTPTPEPGTFLLLGGGLAALAAYRVRRKALSL